MEAEESNPSTSQQRQDMDRMFLSAAVEEAVKGQREGGIPIGSVLVEEGRIIARGHNQRIQKVNDRLLMTNKHRY